MMMINAVSLDDASRQEAAPLEDEIPATRWPTVIGAFSIVYAIVGMTCAVSQVGWFGAMHLIPEMYRGGMTLPAGVRAGSVVIGLLLLVLGGVLMTGGVGLLRRKRSAVATLRKWALMRMIMLVIGAVFMVLTGPAQVQAQRGVQAYTARIRAQNNLAPVAEKSDDQLWMSVMLPAAAGTGVVAIYPMFLAFFLCRRKVDREVTEWR